MEPPHPILLTADTGATLSLEGTLGVPREAQFISPEGREYVLSSSFLILHYPRPVFLESLTKMSLKGLHVFQRAGHRGASGSRAGSRGWPPRT